MAAPEATDPAQAGSDPARPVGLTFGDFLAKMKDPAAADLVRNIKSFIRQFEERPAGQAVDPEADSAAVQAFLAQSEALFRQHPVWRGCQPEVLDQAVEGLEKYVMSKVWRQTFGASAEDRERDERYQRLMQALGFVDLPTLMGAEVHPDEALLGLAQAEFLKMDRYKAPRDKLLCLVNVKTMVENIVGLAAKNGANIGGADAFFPVFLFVLIRSRLPRLASNVEYMKRFRMRSRLSGQFDYMLCNLESGAMYLDTVNYEHLSVSQEAFLRHLAAAGIPEAHLELRRMQQEAERAQHAAAAAADAEGAAVPATSGRTSAAYAEPGADGYPEAEYGFPGAAPQLGVAAEGSAADGAAGDDVLAGLQLADGEGAAPGSAANEGGASGLGSAHPSVPATPTNATAAAAAAGLLGGGGSAHNDDFGLTPLAGSHSPTVLGSLLGTAAAAAAGDGQGSRPGSATTGASGDGPAQLHGGAAIMPRGLSFESASEPASVGEQQAQQEQRRQQQEEEEEEQAVAAAAVAAAAAQQEYSEAALIEEMVAEGTRHVLAAEAAGQLQQRYPFMYAQAEDLSLAEVQAVLVGYKELMLRYEALSRALQQQLGLGSGAHCGSPGASPSAAAAVQATAAGGGSLVPGHRTKQEQEQYGFGSLIIPTGQPEEAARCTWSGQQVAVAPPAAQGSPTTASSRSPSGKWSPGGLLQRIASRGKMARSVTPPRDRDGGRAAGAAEAAEAEPPAQQQGQQASVAGRAGAAGRAGSPSKQGPHPFFTTLFGSGAKAAAAQLQGAPPAMPAPPEQPLPAAPVESSGGELAAGAGAGAEPGAAMQLSLLGGGAARVELGATEAQQQEQQQAQQQAQQSSDGSQQVQGSTDAAAGGGDAPASSPLAAAVATSAAAGADELLGSGASLLDAPAGDPMAHQKEVGGVAEALPLLQQPPADVAGTAEAPPLLQQLPAADEGAGSSGTQQEKQAAGAAGPGSMPALNLIQLDSSQAEPEPEPAALTGSSSSPPGSPGPAADTAAGQDAGDTAAAAPESDASPPSAAEEDTPAPDAAPGDSSAEGAADKSSPGGPGGPPSLL